MIYYLNVVFIEAPVRKTTGDGCTVSMDSHEVPGGMHIVMAADLQCVAFALVGRK